jgi:hypothetical protein
MVVSPPNGSPNELSIRPRLHPQLLQTPVKFATNISVNGPRTLNPVQVLLDALQEECLRGPGVIPRLFHQVAVQAGQGPRAVHVARVVPQSREQRTHVVRVARPLVALPAQRMNEYSRLSTLRDLVRVQLITYPARDGRAPG